MSFGTPSSTQNFRLASAAATGAQATPFQSFTWKPAVRSLLVKIVRQPPPGSARRCTLPASESGSMKRSASRWPTIFQVKSSGLPSKKLPSSWLRSEPRKPSERLAGDTARTRRSAGT